MRRSGAYAAALLAAAIPAIYWLGAYITCLVLPWIQEMGGDVEAVLLRKGPHRFMLRVCMVWMVLFLIILLKIIPWRGWHDTGLVPDGGNWDPFAAGADFAKGILIGLCTLLIPSILMFVTGMRGPDLPTSAWELISTSLTLILASLVVGLFEEIVARGILFRSLARVWNAWSAAIVISVLFAFAHFLRPLPESFAGNSAHAMALAVLDSIPDHLAETEHLVVRVTNLTLMSLVLCAMVWRTRTIWLAAGTHAAWVWMKKMNGLLTDGASEGGSLAVLIGRKTDSTGGVLGGVLLLGLLALILLRRRSTHPTMDAAG